MQLNQGDKVKNITLQTIDGPAFSLDSLKGKPFMLSFLRFATCPFCNLRVNQLVTRFDEFGPDFTIVAIFDSPFEHLVRHANKHKAPFPILADETKKYYREFGIEQSFWGMLKGMIGRMPTLIRGMLKGYIPFPFKGSLITMPADILVDRDGLVHTAYYGKDEGDHLPFEEIVKFSKKK